MFFVGHTRFSLFSPSSNSWVASRDGRFGSADEYRAYLFSDERLKPRADVFLNFTVPMLGLASRDHDFVHVVSFSDSLPDQYKARLEAAADEHHFLVLDEVPAGGSTRNVARIAREMMDRGGVDYRTPFGSMRLDDDDVLSADYFDQMASYITPDHVGYVVTLARGITAIYEGGRFYFARDAVFPLHSKGHLSVCAWGDPGHLRSPAPAAHIHSDRSNPVILDSRKVSHLWTRTLTQDGALLGADPAGSMLREMGRYPEAADDLLGAFPILDGLIGRDSITPTPAGL